MSQGISVKVDVDLSGATKKVSPASVTRGRVAMASQMMMDMDRYIPMRGGALRASGSIGGAGETISYNTVYARAHFYGTNGIVTFRKYTTPGTGKDWLTPAKKANMETWKQKALKEMGF